jgi:hypothetical protein
MEPPAQDEVLDIVDEHDRVVGQAPRRRVYAERLRHRAAFVLDTAIQSGLRPQVLRFGSGDGQ